jgi:hypothetical protein
MKNIFLGTLLLVISGSLAFASEIAVDFSSTQPLQIFSDGRVISLSVAFADDPAKRAQGLMFVKQMADDSGMLFDFEKSRTVNMWMKDTLIPLDMIFLDAKGKVITIARNTKPGSLRRISSAVAVMAVLEVNGGLSRKWGIKRGDQVHHAMFDNMLTLNDDNRITVKVSVEN